MVGAGIKVKLVALVAVPPSVVTVIIPLAPLPTVTVMAVALSAVMAAAVPPMVTAPALDRLVPLMMTDAPTPPLVGVKPVMDGAGAGTNV